MGCDIHICIQRQAVDGSWQEIPHQADRSAWLKTWKSIEGYALAPEHFESRNYDLFGILANVRNGSGFAGITTGLGWPSIAPERGWPEGFDPEAVAPYPGYEFEGPRFMGDHSHTWVSLEELKAFDWSQGTTLYGVISAEEFEKLGPDKRPESWSGGIAGPGIETYDIPTYLEMKRIGRPMAPRPHVRTSWRNTAAEATGWPEHVLPWLEKLADGRPLRLVIGFDS